MSLLMPELERQLRAAVRSGRAIGTADDPGAVPVRRRRLSSLGGVAMVASTVTTIAVAAVILVSLHSSHQGTGRQPRGALTVTTAQSEFPQGTYCGEPVPLNDVARNPVVLAHSDRTGWAVARATMSLPRIGRFTGLVFDLGGHIYLLCGGAVPIITQLPGRTVFWTLTGDTPSPAGHDRLTITGVPGVSIERQPVNDGTFFVALLPRSVCQDRSLTVAVSGPTGRQRFTVPMPKCLPASQPIPVPVTPPAGLTTGQLKQFKRGEVVLGQSGCLACHQLSGNGNNGPGPNLTSIGSQLNKSQLARALTSPRAPMPSFRALAHGSPKKFAALVYFLSQLTGGSVKTR
jgi:hypothetical protein